MEGETSALENTIFRLASIGEDDEKYQNAIERVLPNVLLLLQRGSSDAFQQKVVEILKMITQRLYACPSILVPVHRLVANLNDKTMHTAGALQFSTLFLRIVGR